MDNNEDFVKKVPNVKLQGYPHGMGFYFMSNEANEERTIKLLKYKDIDNKVFTLDNDQKFTFKLDIKKYIHDNHLIKHIVRKNVYVNAVHGENEMVLSIDPDGYLESESWANKTDWVLNNVGIGEDRRFWVVSPEVFNKKYVHVKDNLYKPTYTMYAYKVSENIIFLIKKPFKTDMFYLQSGGYLMVDPEDETVYGCAEEDFAKSYTII